MSRQPRLSTEEQVARYLAKSPEEREANRIARRARRKLSRERRLTQQGTKKSRKVALYNFPGLEEPTTFVCIDLEQYERHQRYLTEVGITTFDTATKRIKTVHIIVKEHYNRRNKKFVCDNKDNFLHGDSVMLTFKEAVVEIERVLSEHQYIVGHNIGCDLKYIRKYCELDTDQVTRYDTNKMFKLFEGKKPQTKLSECCERFGMTHQAPHNAGNDSHINMYLFVVLRKKLLDLAAQSLADKLAA